MTCNALPLCFCLASLFWFSVLIFFVPLPLLSRLPYHSQYKKKTKYIIRVHADADAYIHFTTTNEIKRTQQILFHSTTRSQLYVVHNANVMLYVCVCEHSHVISFIFLLIRMHKLFHILNQMNHLLDIFYQY